MTRSPSAANTRLVGQLQQAGILVPAWRDAFLAVPRHAFLPDIFWGGTPNGYARVDRAADEAGWLAAAYADATAVTQWDDGRVDVDQVVPSSSASMPTMVAGMLDDLAVRDGDRVLEIGTGTGWNAGLLSHRLGASNVVTVEFDKQVADQAAASLAAVGASPLAVVGDGAAGWPGAGPYDAVLATCSVGQVPTAWIDQTRGGGRVVTPFSPLFGGGAVAALTVSDNGTATGRFTRASAFMLLRQQRYQAPPVDAYLPGDWPGDADQTTTRLDPETIGGDWLATFVVGLTVPDVYYRRTAYGTGWTWWLFDTAVTSWATVDSVPGRDDFAVHQSGPRRLWDEVAAAWNGWRAAGGPGFDRYGLTVGPAGHQAWLDTSSNVLARP